MLLHKIGVPFDVDELPYGSDYYLETGIASHDRHPVVDVLLALWATSASRTTSRAERLCSAFALTRSYECETR